MALTLDHLTLFCRNLSEQTDILEEQGFHYGTSEGEVTSVAAIGFQNQTYIEIVEPKSGFDDKMILDLLERTPLFIYGITFTTNDMDKDFELLGNHLGYSQIEQSPYGDQHWCEKDQEQLNHIPFFGVNVAVMHRHSPIPELPLQHENGALFPSSISLPSYFHRDRWEPILTQIEQGLTITQFNHGDSPRWEVDFINGQGEIGKLIL